MSDSPGLSHTDVANGTKQGAVGYVFGGYLDASGFEEVAEKRRPRAEFHVFLTRYATDLVTFEKIVEGGALARLFARMGRPVLGLAVAALEHRRRYRALLITGENVGYPAALYSRLARVRIPINVITHGSFFGSPYMRPVAYALRSNRNVRYLTLSEALRMQMISRFGFAKDIVINTGYGVDTEFFKPQVSEATARPTIASAGVANRDYRTLVAATHDLNVDVRIAADSAWFPGVVDISPDRLPANCEAKSYGNYLRLRELYATAAFVVVPLYPAFHACGLAVIAEAMAMGKAVITTTVSGHSDFIVEGENGFYVAPGDVGGLRAKIKELLDDPARAMEMGLAARSRMTRLFTLEAYVERMIQAIAE
jgi:glycosyltransferase involved in cell wall biosynthesis